MLVWEKEFNYSAINNFAAEQAAGEYLLFLNNDVEILTPQWMEEMLMICQQDQVAVTGAKLYYPDDTIQHAGVVLDWAGCRTYHVQGLPGGRGIFRQDDQRAGDQRGDSRLYACEKIGFFRQWRL